MPAAILVWNRAAINHVDVEQSVFRKPRLEMLGSAAAGIAHDLNNHFTLILNHLEGGNVESARDSVSKCIALTSCLVAFCRGERCTLRPTSLVAVVQDFVNRQHVPAGVKVMLDIDAGATKISGDPAAMERALDNLVRNACTAMKGAGRIRITVRDTTIEVQDSGPGIPRDRLPRIFEPFFTTGGTGLGLAIVRDIMHQHSGAVTVVSEPGRGAKFTLYFRDFQRLL